METKRAIKHLKKLGYKLRIAIQDDEMTILTMDYNPKRVNVEVRGGKIRDITSIG